MNKSSVLNKLKHFGKSIWKRERDLVVDPDGVVDLDNRDDSQSPD